MPQFGPPDVEQFRVDGNVWGLVKALCHRKDGVREDAARALGEIAESLIDGLGSEPVGMRQASVEGLVQLRDARVVEPLIAALKDKNGSVRKAAANALGKISATRSEDLIVAHGDPFGYLRERVVQFRDAWVVEPLIAALKDKNDGVRTAAAKALGKGQRRPMIVDPLIVEALTFALGDESESVRIAAAEGLGRMGDPRAVQALVAVLGDQSESVRKAAAEALDRLGWQPDRTEAEPASRGAAGTPAV